MNKLISEESLFKGPRFEIIRKVYQREDGIKYLRDIVNPGNAVMILAVDSNNDVTFIKQYREAANRLNLELPAGMIDEGELPEEAAKRELEEETGIVANKFTLLKEIFTSSGYSSERIYIYLAEDLEEGRIHLDDTEEINEVVKMSIYEALDYVDKNRLPAACENLALLTYYYRYLR